MANFLIGTVPVTGHVAPGVPIARELVKRGHEVWWYTGERFRDRVSETGARYAPMKVARDFDDRDINSAFPERAGLHGLTEFKFNIKHIFGDQAIGQVRDLSEVLKVFSADVLVCDPAFLGGPLLYEKRSLPYATYGILPLPISSRDTAPFGMGLLQDRSPLGRLRNRLLNWVFDRVILRDVRIYLNKVRAAAGFQPMHTSIVNATLSPFLYLQGTVPAFEYPRSDLPPQVHFIGPFLPERPVRWTPLVWWNELKSGRPVVHVTQGTLATDGRQLIAPAILGLAGEELLVVVATGGKPTECVSLDQIPVNVRIEQFIPYYHLLPYVSVMVTNGGYGGVQAALAHAVPLVVAGESEEKPEIANRVAWAGVGINLRTGTPTSEQVRDAVREILAEPRYRQKAGQIQAEIALHNAPVEAALLLERLAETKRPILRV